MVIGVFFLIRPNFFFYFQSWLQRKLKRLPKLRKKLIPHKSLSWSLLLQLKCNLHL